MNKRFFSPSICTIVVFILTGCNANGNIEPLEVGNDATTIESSDSIKSPTEAILLERYIN